MTQKENEFKYIIKEKDKQKEIEDNLIEQKQEKEKELICKKEEVASVVLAIPLASLARPSLIPVLSTSILPSSRSPPPPRGWPGDGGPRGWASKAPGEGFALRPGG